MRGRSTGGLQGACDTVDKGFVGGTLKGGEGGGVNTTLR